MLWELSIILGKVAAVIVCIAGLIVLLDRPLRLRENVLPFVPEPLIAYFAGTTPAPDVARARDQVIGALDRGPVKATSKKSAAYITTGSTKEEVRKIQGSPTRATEDIWYYGDSHIIFVAGRVASWNSAAANPLKVR